jgi:hypothetical protein
MKRLIGIGIATLFAVACGGGASQTTSATQAASVAPAATSAATAAASASTAAAGPKLTDLVKSGKLGAYKVSYKWTMSGGAQNVDGQQTWYYKPPKARYDYAMSTAGGGALFSVFKLEDGSYFCTSMSGTAFCQKVESDAGMGQNPAADFDLQMSGKPDQFNATFTGTKTIAGQQAQCFGVKALGGAAGFGDTTSCYSSSGVPLLVQMAAQGSSITMEATSFSTTVSDADFKLPGPVR